MTLLPENSGSLNEPPTRRPIWRIVFEAMFGPPPQTTSNRQATPTGAASPATLVREEDSLYDADRKISEYRRLLPEAVAIAVFHHGTAVYSETETTLAELVEYIRTHGPVIPGSEPGDYTAWRIEEPVRGVFVRFTTPQIVHFEHDRDLIANTQASVVGLLLRSARGMDAAEPKVLGYWSDDAR